MGETRGAPPPPGLAVPMGETRGAPAQRPRAWPSPRERRGVRPRSALHPRAWPSPRTCQTSSRVDKGEAARRPSWPGQGGNRNRGRARPPGWGLGHSRWSGDSGGEGRTAQGRGAGLRTPEPAGREHRSLQESPRRERRSPRSAVSLGPPGTTGCFVLFTP